MPSIDPFQRPQQDYVLIIAIWPWVWGLTKVMKYHSNAMGAVAGLESYALGYFPQILLVQRYHWVIPITTSIIRQWSLTLKVKQWSLRHFPTKSFPPGLRGLQTPDGNSCLPGATSSVLLRSMTAFILAVDASLYRKILSNSTIGPKPGEKYRVSRSRCKINKHYEWPSVKGPVGPVCRYGGWRGRPPQEVVSAGEQDWHKHRVWKRGFPARLRLPSPSAPEALFWAPWQEDSKWKGKNKQVCVFYHLQIPSAQGYEWKTLILWPFRFTPGGRLEGRGKKFMKTSTKGTILSLFCPCLLFI